MPTMAHIERAEHSQRDVCADRPADLGSSCCTLFAAQLAIKILLAKSEAQQRADLGMTQVQAMLCHAVKEGYGPVPEKGLGKTGPVPETNTKQVPGNLREKPRMHQPGPGTKKEKNKFHNKIKPSS